MVYNFSHFEQFQSPTTIYLLDKSLNRENRTSVFKFPNKVIAPDGFVMTNELCPDSDLL